jgi:hypothetical protein
MQKGGTQYGGIADVGLYGQDLGQGDGMVDVRRGIGILAALMSVFSGGKGDGLDGHPKWQGFFLHEDSLANEAK